MKKRYLSWLLVVLCLLTLAGIGVSYAKYITKETKAAFQLSSDLTFETYTYAVFDEATGALSIRNREAFIKDGKLIDKDGTYTLGENGVVYALPSKNGVCIANLDNSTVPTDARTDGWDTNRSGNTFEVTITSVVVADPIKLQGNLANLFYGFTALKTADLSNADFSAVNNLYEFFDGCKNLEVVKFDNNNINTSNVENMAKMFSLCNSLATLDLSGFDTQKNTSMNQMFYGCKALTSLNLSSFNTSNVTSMASMFDECHSLTPINLSNFDTSNVTNMSAMFDNCKAITSLDLSSFNTSKVTNMSGMFCACGALQSIDFGSNFNTSNVTTMSQMFAGCASLASLNVSQFNTSKVTDMAAMFQACKKLQTLDVSNFDTSLVGNMASMFKGSDMLLSLDLSNFDTTSVTSMSNMFDSCKKLTSLDLSSFNTSEVTNMSNMFNSCSALTVLDLSNFDTYEVTDMNNMFRQAGGLTTIYVSDGFVVNEGVITTDMFAYCGSLQGGNGTNYAAAQVTDGTYARVDTTDAPGYFTAHKVDRWTDTTDGRHHSGTCSIHKGEIILETHTFVNGVCSKCQNTCQHNIFHNWKTDEDGGTTHSRVCLCGNTTETGTHTYDRNYSCTECGQCDHNVKSWTLVDENTHSGTCTRSSCKAVVIRTHTYTDGKCTVCEAEQVAPQIEVTTNLIVGLTMTCDPAEIIPGQAFTITLTPDAGYVLPDTVTVTINGEDKTAEVAYENGVITIPATLTTGNITISITAEAKQQIEVTDSFADGLTATYDPVVPIPGQLFTVYLAGETFPEAVTVKIDGVEATTAVYDKEVGTITIPGDLLTSETTSITITEAVSEAPTPICNCTAKCEEGAANTECPGCSTTPENCSPVICTCETLCAEGAGNAECPVCAGNAAACSPKQPETPAMCVCTVKCAEGEINPDCTVCQANMSDCLGQEHETAADEPAAPVITVNADGLSNLTQTNETDSNSNLIITLTVVSESYSLPDTVTVKIGEAEKAADDGIGYENGKITIPGSLLSDGDTVYIAAEAGTVEPAGDAGDSGEETQPPADDSVDEPLIPANTETPVAIETPSPASTETPEPENTEGPGTADPVATPSEAALPPETSQPTNTDPEDDSE